MTIDISSRLKKIKPSPTLALAARARELKAQGKDIIDLTVGEPDFPTCSHAKEAAIKAISNDFTKYTAVEGTLNLREAIVRKFQRENNLKYETNQILVSCGAKHSLYNLFQALLNPEDEVIIQAPYWVSYPDMVLLADGKPVIIETTVEQGFKITPEQLRAAITPKTKAFIINSPSNPTGMVYNQKELEALVKVLLQYPQVMIVSDDIYEHILWEGNFLNLVNVCPELYERSMVVNGASKAYAMTGWRIGYAAGPKNVIAAMKNLQSQSTSNPTSISQVAAEIALKCPQDFVTEMCHAFKERHDFLFEELSSIKEIEILPAQGAFYAFPKIEGLMKKHGCKTDMEFADLLLNKAEIAVVPGSAFGSPGYIRISYATGLENLLEAIKRIKQK